MKELSKEDKIFTGYAWKAPNMAYFPMKMYISPAALWHLSTILYHSTGYFTLPHMVAFFTNSWTKALVLKSPVVNNFSNFLITLPFLLRKLPANVPDPISPFDTRVNNEEFFI